MKISTPPYRSIRRQTVARSILFTIFLLIPTEVGLAEEARPVVLGQIVSKGVLVDNLEVPSGTTIFDKTEIRTRAQPARIHLESGQILEMAPKSKVKMALDSEDLLEATVLAGELHYQNRDALPTSAIAGEVVLLPLHPASNSLVEAAVSAAGTGLLGWTTALLIASGLVEATAVTGSGGRVDPGSNSEGAFGLGIVMEPEDTLSASPSVPSNR